MIDPSGIIGHREWAPTRKIDPVDDMDVFRAAVVALGESEGFLMALTDAEQRELLNLMRGIAHVENWPNGDGTTSTQSVDAVVRHGAIMATTAAERATEAAARATESARKISVVLGISEPREAEVAGLAALRGGSEAVEVDYDALADAIVRRVLTGGA